MIYAAVICPVDREEELVESCHAAVVTDYPLADDPSVHINVVYKEVGDEHHREVKAHIVAFYVDPDVGHPTGKLQEIEA